MAVITICGEYGTKSEKIASITADKLGYEYIGDRLVAEIAKEMNISESEAKIFSQTASSKLIRYLDKYTCSMVKKVVDGEHGCLDDAKYYETTKALIENLYNEGDVIIIGWGGQSILKNRPNSLHVRLKIEEETKIKIAMDRSGLDHSNAVKLIKKEEKDLKAYIKHYFNDDWNDSNLYNLIIDMGDTMPEKAAEIISDNIRHKT